MTALSPRLVFLGFVSCWIVGVGTHAARAQSITIPISGTFQAGTADTLGLFGPVGADLSNQPFSVSVTYNSKEFSTPEIPQLDESYTAGAMTISITVNGITVSVTSVANTPSADPATATANFLTPSDPSYGVVGAGSSFGLDYLTSGNASFQQPAPPLPAGIISISVSPAVGKYEFLQGTPQLLQAINPLFVAKSSDLGDIELPEVIKNQSGFGSIQTFGLEADGTSAAIVLLPTVSSDTVTFRTNNGTQLFAYDPQFLNYVPTSGGESTLPVTPKKIGAVFYAAALLQAPLAGVTPAYSHPIIVTAQQDGHTQTTSLQLVPPPVLLVHGLWGDANSLSAYQTTLSGEKPWSSNPGLIDAIQYPNSLAFDNPTSIRLMKTYVAGLVTDLENGGIVGTRIDVVAHSMGGLLLRSYSSNGIYRTLANRNQGQFHTIVTLDTPEAGSLMANYLWARRSLSIAPWAQNYADLQLFWSTYCGANTVTVADCLETNGQEITGGAIQSLFPQSTNLVLAPAPNITGASWHAIAAKNTVSLPSIGILNLMWAVQPNPNNLPTITGILHGANDDIVTVASQLAGSPPLSETDSGLAHAPIFGWVASVTNSHVPIRQTACWLGADNCEAATDVSLDIRNESQAKSPVTFGNLANGRVPDRSTIGQAIPIKINDPTIAQITVQQMGLETHSVRGSSKSEDVFADISADWDGSTLIIKPSVLGKVRFLIAAKRNDGIVRMDTLGVSNVTIDPSMVTGLKAYPFSHYLVIPDVQDRTPFPLYPIAYVRGLAHPIKIGDAAGYRVISQDTDPAVTVNSMGMVRPNHSGQAIIEVSFAGLVDQVEVHVQ